MKSLHIYFFSLALALVFIFSSCKKDSPIIPTPTDNTEDRQQYNLALGNPSNAITDESQEENYLIEHEEYALSYSKSRGIPNWVSWYLGDEWLGSTSRQNDFRADYSLPSGWYKVNEGDYDYWTNGFDRGHVCPSADRTSSINDNSRTFLMTNMIPEAPDHNQITWVAMENYLRDLVRYHNKELYIISGNWGEGGIGDAGYKETINNGRITVPKFIWKVAVVLDRGEDDLARIDEDTRVIAVLTQNTNAVDALDWGSYRTTVDDIEAATGYDLLSNVPESIQVVLESWKDDGPVE